MYKLTFKQYYDIYNNILLGALSACYLYGKNTFPISTYLPILAKNKKGEILKKEEERFIK